MTLSPLAVDEADEARHSGVREHVGEKDEEAIHQARHNDVFAPHGLHKGNPRRGFSGHARVGAFLTDAGARSEFSLSRAGTKDSHRHSRVLCLNILVVADLAIKRQHHAHFMVALAQLVRQCRQHIHDGARSVKRRRFRADHQNTHEEKFDVRCFMSKAGQIIANEAEKSRSARLQVMPLIAAITIDASREAGGQLQLRREGVHVLLKPWIAAQGIPVGIEL